MKLNYQPSESTVRPEETSFDGHDVRLVRNIVEEECEQTSGEKITYFTYEEAVLSPTEFQVYTNFMMMQSFFKSQE